MVTLSTGESIPGTHTREGLLIDSTLLGLCPGLPEDPQEIAVKDSTEVGIGVAATFENTINVLQIGDGVEVERALLSPESAIKVAADSDVPCVSGELTDVVNMVGDVGNRHSRRFRGRGAFDPAGDHHPGIEDGTEDGIPLDEETDLFVAELPGVINERPAIRVTRPNGSGVNVQSLEKAGVTEMSHVEDDPEFVHFANEIGPAWKQSADLIVTECVAAPSVVSRSHRAETIGVGLFKIVDGDDGVCSLKTENIPYRRFCRRRRRRIRPEREVGVELFEIPDLDHFAEIAEGFVVGALPLGHAPGLTRGFPAGDRGSRLHAAADLGRDTETNPAFSHFIKADCVERAAFEVRPADFQFPDPGDRERQITVPFEGVEAEIEMNVKNQIHGWGLEIR